MRDQRVARQIVVRHVILQVLRRPFCQRVHLDLAPFLFKQGQVSAFAALKLLAPGDPAVEIGQGFGQWPRLAQISASVSVGLMQQPVHIFDQYRVAVGADDAHIG